MPTAQAQAGFSTDIEVGASITNRGDGTFIGGVKDVTFSPTDEDLDVTDLDVSAYEKIKGLQDVEFTITCNYDSSDAGESLIEDKHEAKEPVDIVVYPDGAVPGFKARYMVSSRSINSDVEDVTEVEYSFMLIDGNRISKVTS